MWLVNGLVSYFMQYLRCVRERDRERERECVFFCTYCNLILPYKCWHQSSCPQFKQKNIINRQRMLCKVMMLYLLLLCVTHESQDLVHKSTVCSQCAFYCNSFWFIFVQHWQACTLVCFFFCYVALLVEIKFHGCDINLKSKVNC